MMPSFFCANDNHGRCKGEWLSEEGMRPCPCDCHMPEDEGPACVICDGLGHNYIVGWHEVPGKGTQPIIGGGTCPMEEGPYRYDPTDRDEDLPF